jgi:hypothetical protein
MGIPPYEAEPSYQRQDRNGVTLAYKLADLSWDMAQGGMVHAGSMAIHHEEQFRRAPSGPRLMLLPTQRSPSSTVR